MNWPWQRFEAFFGAFMKRKQREQVMQSKLAITAGFWGNSNLDDEKNTRGLMLEDLEQRTEEAIELIYAPPMADPTKTDPLFTAIKLPDVPEGMETVPLGPARLEVKREIDQS